MYIARNLAAEHADRPLGLWTSRPRLSWDACTDAETSASPSGFQIHVASTAALLDSGEPDLWDSGQLPVTGSPLITYAGVQLFSRQRCWWKVRLFDEGGAAGDWSEPTWFELSLLEPSDWKAGWTARPGSTGAGALYLRQPFQLEQPARRARLYITGLGWIEPRLNGHRVGKALLDPVTTDITKRIPFRTYDVTDLLQQGVNVLAAVLGHGWGGSQKLCAQLEITLENGTELMVGTGGVGVGVAMWNAYQGPIIEDSVYDGESYDARLENPAWDTAALDLDDPAPMRDLQAAMVAEGPGGALEPAPLEPIEVVETGRGISLTEPHTDVFVLDTGQNAAGWLRITVDGPAGTEITLRYSENLYADGTVDQENLRSARATDRYTLNGNGHQTWEPSFTYHGYRYVQIEGWPGRPTLDDLEVRIVRSAMARRAEFDCSDDLIQAISDAVFWTEASNVHGIPTDCPQRNERMGWLNDMAARSEELVYNFDTRRFLAKFVTDIADTQDELGAIADTAPFRFGSRPADPVSVCYALIPWLLIQHHGDYATAERHFPGIRRWFDYLTSRAENGILEYSYYGDWAPPVTEGVEGSRGTSAIPAFTPGPLTSTAHYYYTGILLMRLAEALGHDEETARLAPIVDGIRTAFHERFWSGQDIGYGTGNQACNTLALYFGLVPEDHVGDTLNALVTDIQKRDIHLSTGNLCTKYVLEVLAEHGHADLAVDLVRQTSYPSWGYMIANGATTIWERWELATGGGMNSHNHPMYASVGAWLYRWLAGIQVDATASGMSKVTIRPHLTTPQVDRVSAQLATVRGPLSSGWRRESDATVISVEIPLGVEADLHLPADGGTRVTLDGSVWSDVEGRPLPLPPGRHEVRLSGLAVMA